MVSNTLITKKRSVTKYLSIFCLFALVILSSDRNAFALPLPSLFQDELVLPNLDRPTSVVFLPDGRALVTQKRGKILIFDPRLDTPVLTPYMTLPNINFQGERGLLDIVLDPDFPTQPYIYIVYHGDGGDRARMYLSRFTHLGDTADVNSEFVVWQDPKKFFHPFHQGGGLSFGPDGYLYLTTGEQYSGFVAQDMTKAGGKIIRIAKDGSIPSDNPFIDGEGGNLDEIWALGLRNPWRSRWDIPPAGSSIPPRLFIGEVGGNLGNSNEDLHIGRKGANFGWPHCEGNCSAIINANNKYDDPLYTHEHLGKGASIIAGFVYRGGQFPAEYSEVYFFGDYSRRDNPYKQGIIHYLTFDSAGNVTNDMEFSEDPGLIVDLKEGPNGALYYLQIAKNEALTANTGALRRIIYNDGNQAPHIISTSTVGNITDGDTPLTVQFEGIAEDEENDPLSYLWIFGDGSQAEGANVTHTYTENGSYQAKLQVNDGGKTTTSNPPIIIVSGSKPEVVITEPAEGSFFRAGEAIHYSATATDSGSVLTEASYEWNIIFIHNQHTHPQAGPIIGSSGIEESPTTGHSFFDDTGFKFTIDVTNSFGVATSKFVNIYPEKVDINFQSNPSGVSFFIDGILITTPIIYDTAIDFIHNITAPQITCLNGSQKYKFVNWSNGAAASHNYTIPEHNETLTAQYVFDGICDSSTNISPLAFLDEVLAPFEAAKVIDVLANDVDSDGTLDSSTVVIVRNPLYGNVSVDSVTGAITYTHDGSAVTSDSFSYTVKDALGETSNEATVLVTLSESAVSCEVGAVELDGLNDWINIPNLTLPGDFTLEGWVNLESDINYKDGIFGNGTNVHLHFYSGKPRLTAYGTRITANTVISPNTWSHIALTRSGSTLKMYINGEEDTSTGSWNGALVIKTLGKGYRGFFKGMMDEMRVWNIARTSTEINSNYNKEVDPNTEGLLAHWSMNGTDQIITDSSSFANHASLGVSDTSGADDPVRLDETALSEGSCNGGNNGGGSSNVAPVANSDEIGPIQIGGAINFSVTDNDIDSDNNLDLTSVLIVSQPSNGNVSVNSAGTISYTHTGAIAITDTFTYRVQDSQGATSNVATVSITITEDLPSDSSVLVDEFNNSSEVGEWVIQKPAPALSSFVYTVSPEKITIGGSQYNRNLTRLNTDIDSTRPYSITSTFKITNLTGIRSYVVHLLQSNQPASQVANAWTLSLDLNAGGQVKYLGFRNGAIIGNIHNGRVLHAATWAQANTEYIFQIDVNRRLDGTVSPKWVTGKFTDLNGDVKDHFEVYFGNFKWQPTLNETVRIGLGSHGADWESRNLVVRYTDNQQNINHAPIANAGADQTAKDNDDNGSETITLNGGLSTDSDGDTLTYNWSVNQIAIGSGQIITHSFNVGTHQVKLTVNDGHGHITNDTMTVTVNPADVNTPPIANAGVDQTVKDNDDNGSEIINLNGSLSTDSDGDTLTYSWSINQTPIGSGQNINHTFNIGIHQVTLTIDDGHEHIVTDTVTVTVLAADVLVNIQPVAQADTATVQQGNTVMINVLNNDSDSDGTIDSGSIAIASPPAFGTLSVDTSTGIISYNHDGLATTSDSFTYSVADEQGARSSEVPVTITITPSANSCGKGLKFDGNNDWVNIPDLTLQGDFTVESWVKLATGIDPKDSILGDKTYTHLYFISGKPRLYAYGVRITATTAIAAETWTHIALTRSGSDLTMYINGEEDATARWTGSLNIKSLGQGYRGFFKGMMDEVRIWNIARTSSEIGTTYDTNVDPNSTGLIGYWKFNGSSQTVTDTSSAANHASLGFNFVEATDDPTREASTTLFSETCGGEGGGENSNVAPHANSDSIGPIQAGQTITFSVTDNDTDSDGNLNSENVVIVSSPAQGNATVNPSGTITYSHYGATTGATDTLTYKVSDTEGAFSNVATVSISITATPVANEVPIAINDSATVVTNEMVVINVLDNDYDNDGTLNPSTLIIVNQPSSGSVEINGSGSINYTHNGSTSINDSFTYKVADDEGAMSNIATVEINITTLASACGMGVELDGKNDLINIPDVNLTSDFTVEGWVKLQPGIDYRDGLFGNGTNTHLYFVSGKVRLYAFGVRITGNTVIQSDTWTHIALTRSGRTLKLYIDGAEDATGSWPGTLNIKSLGKGYRGYFKGQMDEFRIWNVARTGTEISTSFNTTVGQNTIGLIGNWNFNGAGQVITDTSNELNHGSLGLSLGAGTDDPVRTVSSAPFIESCI